MTPGFDISRLDPRTQALLRGLMATGLDVNFTSGFRSPDRNRAVGGARGSQHVHGRALDVDISKLTEAQRETLLKVAVEHGARGFGIYPSGRSLHLDTRETPAVWGPRPGAPHRGVPLASVPAWARGALAPVFGQPAAAPAAQPASYAPAASEASATEPMGPRVMNTLFPRPLPPAAPQPVTPPEPMGLFQRSGFMQRDRESGEYLDPTLAARAQGAPMGDSFFSRLLGMFRGG